MKPAHPKTILLERDFYRLPNLSHHDVEILDAFVDATSAEPLKQTKKLFIRQLHKGSQAAMIAQARNGDFSDEEREVAESFVLEAEELLHGAIERTALPLLRELRGKRVDFFEEYEQSMDFIRFLTHQYFRTKKIRGAIGNEHSRLLPGLDFSHLSHIVSHIAAENVGSRLFVDRRNFQLTIAETHGHTLFVTGDQPVVNLLGTGDGRSPEELAFYYPLAPTMACFLMPSPKRLPLFEIPDDLVGRLNGLIAWSAAESVVGSNSESIKNALECGEAGRPELNELVVMLNMDERWWER